VSHIKKGADPKENLKKDLEVIFDEAMAAGKLSVALKAKELLAKLNGIFLSSREREGNLTRIKPLSQWSEQELKDFLNQLDDEAPSGSEE
jgi:3'-phosphoadenosine 5'-phosphosulfate sulfotransferase (PAPS reductase)/FAD synthetase